MNLHKPQMVDQSRFSERTVSPDPFIQFALWYGEHLSAGIEIPESVYLGTASSDGRVSIRTVLLKDYGEYGFTFFTNYHSRKGLQLTSNNHAALLFYWPEKKRQVRIEGTAEKVSPVISEAYFKSRPRESQLAAWASEQSSVIPGRPFLEEKYEEYKNAYSGFAVPRPDHWGGYRIIPDLFEFWEDRENRLHDRLIYERDGDAWRISRLAP